MFISSISASRSDVIDECLLKYYRRYVERLPGFEKANEDQLNFGTFVHKVFELGYQLKSSHDLLKLAEAEKQNHKIKKQFFEKLKSCVENFVVWNSAMGETVDTEWEFEVPLDEKNDIKLIGIVDRIIKGSKGGYLIVDYKTSKREKKKSELQMDKQLMGYAYAVHMKFGVPFKDIYCSHFYPVTGHFVMVQFSKILIANWKRKEIDKVWRIRKKTKNDFPAMENMFCNYCEFKPCCPKFNSDEVVKAKLEEQVNLKRKLDEEKALLEMQENPPSNKEEDEAENKPDEGM